jgi:uncharacterized protein with HEPN domain
MPKDDLVRLWHMLDAAREAVSFSTGKSRSDLDTERMLVLSLVKSLEIIGEAASRVSAAYQGRHPEIPWLDIIGMRHRLIHAYYDVNLDIVWRTVVDDLPPLIATLEELVQPGSGEDG